MELLDRQGRPVSSVEFDDEVILRVHVQHYEDAAFSILGSASATRPAPMLSAATRTRRTSRCRLDLPATRSSWISVSDCHLRQYYSVSTALAYDRSKPSYFDWVDNAWCSRVLPPESGKVIHGKVSLPVHIAVHVQ